jgi:integrase
LQKEGHENSSYPAILKRLVKNGANLLSPESVREIIAKRKCKGATKILEVYAYDAFTKMLKIEWSKPHYIQEEILPFIPEERELDQLIAACKSRRMATFLQTLKETFADPGEALKLRWRDITGNIVSITPVKGHRPRQLTVSAKLLAMLNSLPRTNERIFPTTYAVMNKIFWGMKKRVANVTQNPRLKAISFNTFRHWGATITYHYTGGNLLLVQKILGHKRITSTMKYTQLVCLKEDEYDIGAATTIEEDQQLLKAGFEYVTERNSIKLYRRPKIFAKYMDKR